MTRTRPALPVPIELPDIDRLPATDKKSDAVGPILVVGLAAVVGFFALAIFLPMWDLTQVARKGF